MDKGYEKEMRPGFGSCGLSFCAAGCVVADGEAGAAAASPAAVMLSCLVAGLRALTAGIGLPVTSGAPDEITSSESEGKCLTCNQKPTGSRFSLLHESN